MNKPYFKQHIPSFVEGVEPKKFEFEKLEDIFKKIELDDDFYWCYDDGYFNYQYLMEERKDKKEWWVIGYVYNYDLSKELPKWMENKKND